MIPFGIIGDRRKPEHVVTTTHNCIAGHDVHDSDLVGMVNAGGTVRKYCIAHAAQFDTELRSLNTDNVQRM